MTSRFFIIFFLTMIKIVCHPSLANESPNQERIARSDKSSKTEQDENVQLLRDNNKDFLENLKAYKPIPLTEKPKTEKPEQPKKVVRSHPSHENMSSKKESNMS